MMMMIMMLRASTDYSHVLLLSSPPRLPIRSVASSEISTPVGGGLRRPYCEVSPLVRNPSLNILCRDELLDNYFFFPLLSF